MNVKDYLIAALLILVVVLLATRKQPPAQDFTKAYDSLQTVVDQSYRVIDSVERRNLQKAAEISRLNRQISTVQEDQAKTVSKYQRQIESLRTLKTPQTDSILARLYGDPLDSKSIVIDLAEGDQAKELLPLVQKENKELRGVISNQLGIIDNDSIEKSKLRNIIASNNERFVLNDKELDRLKNENKKLRRTNRWLKIAVPVAFVVALFVPN